MAWTDRIKKLVKRDKGEQIAEKGKGWTHDDPMNSAIDNVAVSAAYNNLKSALSMDQALMSRYVDYENMDDYPELNCLSGESLIFELSSGWVPIKDLVKKSGDFYVMSYDKERRSIVPALCSSVRVTHKKGHSKRMVRVIFDNGQSILCTDDHRFMKKNEEWVEAKDLKFGDSLMPAYIRLRNLSMENHQYWQVHQPHSDSKIRSSDGKRWVWLHRLVGGMFLGAGFNDVVHHKISSLNNDPSCLSLEDKATHAKHHIAKIDNTRFFPEWTDEKRLEMSARMKGNTYAKGNILSEETKRKMSIAGKGRKKSEEWKRKIGQSQPNRIDIDIKELETALSECGTIAAAARKLGVSWSKVKHDVVKYDLLSDKCNHRVLRVDDVENDDELYDLQVPKYENFACNGVIVHNCALDIFADDTTITDNLRGKTIWAESKDTILKDIIDDCLHRRIRIEEDIWLAVRTLAKYGNVFSEIVVTEIGVVGLNFLPVPTMRRLVTKKGDLIGYVQDLAGEFNIEGFAIDDINKLKEQAKERGMIFFEPWEIVHWRLRSKFVQSLYGYCLSGSSQVWTSNGHKRIDEINSGDVVYCRHAGMLRSTKVIDKVCSGTKSIFRLQTKHREICLTGEHPVLVEKSGRNAWVKVSNLNIGDKIAIVTTEPESLPPPPLGITLQVIDDNTIVTLSKRGSNAIKSRMVPQKYNVREEGLRCFYTNAGISKGIFDELLDSRGGVSLGVMRKLFYECDIPFFEGAYQVSHPTRLVLPDFVDEQFARWFGFMLGDGWISGNQVSFAMGTDEEQNCFYENILRTYGLSPYRFKDEVGVERQVVCGSIDLIDILKKLGWNGEKAHNKRVPGWMFVQNRSIRKAFLRGFMDADGWKASEREHVELCNRDLVKDLKGLIDGLGWRSGSIRTRPPRESKIKTGVKAGKIIKSKEQYILTFDHKKLSDDDFYFDRVKSIESIGEDLVYDIGVEENEHNFIADGIVVHNSVLDATRWIWKRLAMLEDTALVYKLTRSPGRYAFYIDTGDLPPDEAMGLVRKVKRQYKKRTLVNPSTGELEFRNNPISPEDDMWIPTRGGKESTRVDVLSGPDWQSMEDIQYFRDKMFTSIKIPRSYYGGDAEADQGLAQKDVRFARTCMRIQREFRNGIRQIIRVHLAALNIDPDTVEWDTRMTMPSSIFELQQIEVMNAQAGLIETLSQYFPKEWLLRRVLHLSQDDAMSVMNDKSNEEEKSLMDQARIASSIEKKYPGIDIGDATAPTGDGDKNEDVKFSKEIKKLTEMVSKSIQESNMVIKRLEEMDLSSRRDTRRIDNSVRYIRRVK